MISSEYEHKTSKGKRQSGHWEQENFCFVQTYKIIGVKERRIHAWGTIWRERSSGLDLY